MEETRSSQNYLDAHWLSQEGQLSVDVAETLTSIVVRSAIAGVRAEDLDISLSEDTLTIRGARHLDDHINEDQLIVQECHWGAFSRSIILPSPVDPDSVDAVLKRGILTIRLKKIEMEKRVPVHERF